MNDKQTNSFLRALRIDLRRSISSGSFCITVLLLIIWLIINCSDVLFHKGFRMLTSLPEMLNVATIDQINIAYLLFAIAPFCYAWSYYTDCACSFAIQAIERVGVENYALSKVISTAVSAFLAAIAAMSIFSLFLCILHLPYPDKDIVANKVAYLQIVADGKIWLYLLVRFIITGLTCSFAAVFSLTVSSFLPNRYVAILSPLMFYYFTETLLDILAAGTSFRLSFNAFYQVINDSYLSAIWTVGYFLLLILLSGWIFCVRLRREWEQ